MAFTKTKIGIDIDGVLSMSNEILVDKINKLKNSSISIEDIHDYWYTNISHIISLVEINKLWDEIHLTNALHEAEIISGSLEAMESFYNKGYNMEIVTHRQKEFEKDVNLWLEKKSIVRQHNVCFCKGKKSEYGAWDYFIDDSPDNLEDLVSSNKVFKKALLFTQPYNKNYEINHEKIQRVYNWEEVISIIN